MDPQRRMRIYVSFESPSIIRYLEPLTGDQFQARFVDCHFNETIFSSLRGENVDLQKRNTELIWKATHFEYLDPKTKLCEQEVHRIVHLQSVVDQLPDAYIDNK